MREIKAEKAFECEDGVYHSKVVEIEDYHGGYGPAVRVFFRLDPKIGVSGVVNGIFPMKATPKNKTGSLLLASLGECIPGTTYNLDSIMGTYVYVQIENVTTSEGTFPRAKRAIWPPPKAAALESPAGAQQAQQGGGQGHQQDNNEGDEIPF